MIDESTLLIMQSAMGAYTCRTPPIPRKWDSLNRPHVALLIHSDDYIFRVFLSKPSNMPNSNEELLDVSDLESLPQGSVVEIRNDSTDISYYLRENDLWKKVAESKNPFLMEIYSHGSFPLLFEIVT